MRERLELDTLSIVLEPIEPVFGVSVCETLLRGQRSEKPRRQGRSQLKTKHAMALKTRLPIRTQVYNHLQAGASSARSTKAVTGVFHGMSAELQKVALT